MNENENQSLTVWEWLEEKHWQYLPMQGGHQSPSGHQFITEEMIYMFPGDVSYYLRTGFVRNPRIFDSRWQRWNPDYHGFKKHKDGTCVQLKRVK